jgi:endonuclease/exonuclease/phosphatase family metal-dependent hydrolase
MHVGAGDLSALLSALGAHPLAEGPRPPFVLLLQEALRRGPVVPPLAPGARAARRIVHDSPDARLDIVEAAHALGLWAAYVPSMRNGAGVAEDRGNAIVSNRPLEAVSAIELPGGRQRRVAVAADVTGRSPDGLPWRVRVASVHLESQSGPRRLWVFAGAVRAAQMRAVVEALEDEEVAVLGGDFNSWAGFDETAYREAADAFPDTVVTDPRPTFAWRRRLDHLLFRLPDGWRARFARLDERYGSDHHPLAGVVTGVGPHPGRFCDPCAPERDTPGASSSLRPHSGARTAGQARSRGISSWAP